MTQLSSQISAEKQINEDEVQISYFVKKPEGKSSRVCLAKLLDLSNVGLCMEISPLDSELYMESGGTLFLLNKTIEIQIYCRFYPTNVSVEGHVKWLQRKGKSDSPGTDGRILVGALFRFDGADQRRDLAELVGLLKNDTVNCRECNAPVSADAPLCYNCGARLTRRRAFLKKIFDNLLAGNKDAALK